MTPKEFCAYHGFTLQVEEPSENKHLINIIDDGRKIFKTGKRQGTFLIPLKRLTWHLNKGYNELMWLILDKVYV